MLAEHVLQRLVQEVGGGVVRHRRKPDRPRHDRSYARPKLEPLAAERQHLVVVEPGRAEELGACARSFVLDVPGVGDLTAALRIEGRLLELRLEAPVAEILVGDDRRQHVGLLVADELGARRRAADAHVDVERRSAARSLALLLHQACELFLVHLEPALGRELLRQLERKAVRVVQAKGFLGSDLALGDDSFEQLLPTFESLGEPVFLTADVLLDSRLVLFQLRVDGAHLPTHDRSELPHESVRQPELSSVTNRASNDPPQDVPAAFVRRHDTLGDQERRGASVLDDDPVGLRHLRGRPVRFIRMLPDPGEQRLEGVDVEERVDALEEHRRPLEAHARVDVLLRERRQRAVLGEVELHEDEVPELEVALALATGPAARPAAAVLLAAVVEDLRARAARAGVGGLPEILRTRQADDPLAREKALPASDRDLVLAEAELRIAREDGHPELARVETHLLGDELPREVDRPVLEVVAEREVAEHLEEGAVPVGAADVVEVVVLPARPDGLLNGGNARCDRLFDPEKPPLHRLHARDDEERRGVVGRRDHGRRGTPHMTLLLEEGQKSLAQLGRRAHEVDSRCVP